MLKQLKKELMHTVIESIKRIGTILYWLSGFLITEFNDLSFL